ncbi:MAG TPA: hypothetical protein VGR81_00495 [Candidatus Acidoferrales bacterium]|nr:hypothetical protein [Candidatus Acidoferrales bacterium]
MNRRFQIFAVGLWLLLLQCSSAAQQCRTSIPEAPVSSGDIHSLIQAIQDEIYANHLQADGYDAGVPAEKGSYQLQLYIQPAFNNQGLAWAIYKLMPYGEVLRMFWIGSDGTAFLYGRPEDRFPPSQPSYLTAYMDDAELLHAKQTWTKTSFALALNLSAPRRDQAIRRQRRRVAATSTVSSAEAAAARKDSRRAAQEANAEPDPTGGATHFFLDYGQPLPVWAIGASPIKTFGPFLKTLENGNPSKDVKVKIVIIR